MRYLALCTDYDGTIAHHGRVDDRTLDALQRLRGSGRRLVMVTGREIEDLRTVFNHFQLFESIVAENGAVIYHPSTGEEQLLGEAPPSAFVEALRRRGVERISVGRRIVATWEPHENTVLETIRDEGLDLQVIFNKGAVMILPAGVNKATGLRAALDEMNLSIRNAVGVGDAENDHAFLSICECSAAVANALPAVKEKADIVLARDHGAGVTELIDQMIEDDLARHAPGQQRHTLELGVTTSGEPANLTPYGENVLMAGGAAEERTGAILAFVAQLEKHGYNFCLCDTRGSYCDIEDSVVLGSKDKAPSIDETVQLLCKPRQNAVLDLQALQEAQAAAFVLDLATHIRELRTKTGRPHWVVLDDAPTLLPADAPSSLELDRVLLSAARPGLVRADLLSEVGALLALGEQPGEMLGDVPREGARAVPADYEPGKALWWKIRSDAGPQTVTLAPDPRLRRN